MTVEPPPFPCRIEVLSTPEDLRRRGPLVPARMMSPKPGSPIVIEGFMLLDTGATGFLIDESVAAELQLPVEKKWQVHGVHGHQEACKYIAKVSLPARGFGGTAETLDFAVDCTGNPGLRDHYVKAFGVPVLGMIGRNFMQFCQVNIDGQTGRVEIVVHSAILRPSPA